MADEAAATRDADDSLRAAMAVGTLESLMDVIHSRGSHATPEVLEEAKALRDQLRKEKHASAGALTLILPLSGALP